MKLAQATIAFAAVSIPIAIGIQMGGQMFKQDVIAQKTFSVEQKKFSSEQTLNTNEEHKGCVFVTRSWVVYE